MKAWKNKTCAGVAFIAVLAWTSPSRLRADTTTQKKTAGTAKPKTRSAPQHRTHKGSIASQHSSTHRSSKRHVSSKAAQIAAAKRRRAQLRPEPQRIEEIQQALAKAGYLKAQPNGLWDDGTRDAMRRYQTDHGFAVTGLPEAKSLMKLGLGPHPLPPDLDTSSGAAASTETDAAAPAAPVPSTPTAPDAPQTSPATTPPPEK